jgi:ABC-type oligopeptide transport system substrate-binding subunit
MLAGRSTTVRGVIARGDTLVVRFVRPTPGFAARMSLPFFCAVPPTLYPDPEGVAVFPSAGPYRVTDYRPGERVVIRRNRFYGGTRPHHVDGFDVDLRAPSLQEMMQRIERGDADWGYSPAGVFFDPALALEAKYGINRSRFFVKPGLTLRMIVFNSSRPLFRNNPRLRKAVNLALDRRALQLSAGLKAGVLTDQYLPHALPGFRDADIYPLDRPDTARAAELARGNLRGGKAVLYTTDAPIGLVPAQLAARQLAEIGLEVEVRKLPVHLATFAYLEQLTEPGAAWDLAFVLYTPNLPDPYAYINLLFDRRFIGRTNLGRFESSQYDTEMRRAARVPQNRDRFSAYGALDVRLASDVAPIAAISVLSEATLVSGRVGCMVFRPVLDLTAACLK